jgi:hypothetical protein
MNKTKITTYQKWTILQAIVFMLSVFVYWRFVASYVLFRHEEWQMFLFDREYFLERLVMPCGIARYTGEFVSQFAFNLTVGAFVYTLVFGLIQYLSWLVMKRLFDGRQSLFALSMVPSLYLMLLMQNCEYTMALPITFLVGDLLLLFIPSKRIYAEIYLLVTLPMMLWITGVVTIPFAMIAQLYVFRQKSLSSRIMSVILTLLICGLLLTIIPLWLDYPAHSMSKGEELAYEPSQNMISIYIYCVVVLLVMISPLIRNRLFSGGKIPSSTNVRMFVLSLGLLIVFAFLVPVTRDTEKVDDIRYDMMMCHHDWQGILKQNSNRPSQTLSAQVVTMMAMYHVQAIDKEQYLQFLVKTGQQPQFRSIPFVIANVYMDAGFVNMAQRAAFDAMESIPNYNKSAHAFKWLVEASIVTGQSKVADKYIRLLASTLYYRLWAESLSPMVANPQLVGRHPVYGPMQRFYKTTPDMFFY